MTEGKTAGRLDFEALRLGIERCDPDGVLGFYAEDAELSIVNAEAPRSSLFELRGKAEIAKHLRAVFVQETSHRVEQGIMDEDRVSFREACEYPDGTRIVVETTLEVRDSRIFRQVDVVASDARADSQEEISRGPPTRRTSAGVDESPPDRLLRSKHATEKEDLK
jgi:hypothetical protein